MANKVNNLNGYTKYLPNNKDAIFLKLCDGDNNNNINIIKTFA
jgi:hypothetical protein